MLREKDSFDRGSSKNFKSSKGNTLSEPLMETSSYSMNSSGNSSSHLHRKTVRHHHHSSRHSTAKHHSPKSTRHKLRSCSNKNCTHAECDNGNESKNNSEKSSPPPKLLKMSHKRKEMFQGNNEGDDSSSSSSAGPQEETSQLYKFANKAENLRSMNSSDCSTSPESPVGPKNGKHRGLKHSSDSSSGISSMSSGGSDSSPNSFFYGDKERERSLNGESTDPGSDGSSPMPSVASANANLQGNFQTSLTTVLEVNTQIDKDDCMEMPSDQYDPKTDDGNSNSAMTPMDKFCLVCGDKATGYHFNALTCEGCKGFFRRNSQKLDELKCSFSNCCKITKVTRRHCQACRLKKCFKVGMLTECIMTEEQKVVRKMKNTDKHNQAAQQEAINAAAAQMNLPHSQMMGSHQVDSNSRYANQYHHSSPTTAHKRSRNNSSSVAAASNVYSDQELTSAAFMGGLPNYTPPNQEQLALMEELSIEYHNLYSKKATVEDVISNVPTRPSTMDSCAPLPPQRRAHQQHHISSPPFDPNNHHQGSSPASSISEPLTIINPTDSSASPQPSHPPPNPHQLLMPAPPMASSEVPENTHTFGASLSRQEAAADQTQAAQEAELSKMCKYLAAITSNRLERCVAFCQRMPGFQLLSLQDKMSLLKSGAFEILLLRSSIFMDASMDKIKAGSFTLTPDMLMRIPYLRPFVCPFFLFISKFKSLNCDLTELLLLIGIVLFSPDRPGVQNKDAISNIQQVYADTLQAYLSTKYCQAFIEGAQHNHPENRNRSLSGSHPVPFIKSEHGTQRATCGSMLDDSSLLPSARNQNASSYQTQNISKLTAALISPTHGASLGGSLTPGSQVATPRSPSTMLMKSRTRFGSLMMQVCMLRSVNFEHSQSILQIDVRRKEDIGPFLREMLVATGSNSADPTSQNPSSYQT